MNQPSNSNMNLFGQPAGAVFSECRTFRYQLFREWDVAGTTCVFIGLNPSTADENVDDPTIRRCIQYAKDWGHGRLVMLNLFAYRSTDPGNLTKTADPVGPDNDQHILLACKGAGVVVAAWGNHGQLNNRNQHVVELINGHVDLMCLKITGQGNPIHPLYQPKSAFPIPYNK